MNVCLKFGLVASTIILVAVSSVAQQSPNRRVLAADGSVSTASSDSGADRAKIASDSGSDIGEPVYEVGGPVRPPIAIHTPDPKFSKQARKAKFSGNVLIALVVDSHGNPRNVHVVRGVGMGLDESALDAVKRYRFKPALEDGKPVAVRINVEVNYVFEDRGDRKG